MGLSAWNRRCSRFVSKVFAKSVNITRVRSKQLAAYTGRKSKTSNKVECRIMDFLAVAKIMRTCLNHLDSVGLSAETSHDFMEVQRELPSIGKERVSRVMDVSNNDFTSDNAFWILLRRREALVACMGMRIDRLGDESAADFWCRAIPRQYGAFGSRIEIDDASRSVLKKIKGKLVFMGDLHFDEPERGNEITLITYVHLAHCICFSRWNPKWIYAFHRRWDVFDGYAAKYGFSSQWPGVQTWTNPPDYRSSKEYLSVISRKDFNQRVGYFSRNPDVLLTPSPRSVSRSELRNC